MKHRFLNLILHLALHKKRFVLISTIILTLFSIFLASQLTIDTKWTEILSKDLPIVKEFAKVEEEFASPSSYIIAVESDDYSTLEKVTDEIIDTLKNNKYILYINGKQPEDFWTKYGLRIIKPNDLKRAALLFSDPNISSYIKNLNTGLENEYLSTSEDISNDELDIIRNISSLENLSDLILKYIEYNINDEILLNKTIRDLTTGNPYFISIDRKMSIIMAAPNFSLNDLKKLKKMDEEIAPILKNIDDRYSNATIRRTGDVPLGKAELDSIGLYSMILTLIALIVVFLYLIWNFGDIITPCIGILSLIIGIIWALGFYALTVEKLTIFTAIIMLVLIGLGIDFSIHIISRFKEERSLGINQEEALKLAVIDTGRGIIIGAVTTALAFLTLLSAQTQGIKELGFCAGTGVIISMLAVFYVTPSMLIFYDNYKKKKKAKCPSLPFLTYITKTAEKYTIKICILSFILCAAGIWAAFQIPFEYNFLELEPISDSIYLEKDIIEKFKMSTQVSSITVDTVEEARILEQKLRTKPVVGMLDTISTIIPDKSWNNNLIIEKLRKKIVSSQKQQLNNKNKIQELEIELQLLYKNLMEIKELSFISGQDRIVSKLEKLTSPNGSLQNLINKLNSNHVNTASLYKLSSKFYDLLKSRIIYMTEYNGNVSEKILPDELLYRYKSKISGRYIVHIYPKRSIYEKESLQKFTESVNKISPNVTGVPQLALETSELTVRDGKYAALLATIAILIIVIIDFRKAPISAVFLTIFPLFAAICWTALLMWLFSIKFNFVNVIAVPIIVGIGIDNGVHIMQRYLANKNTRMETITTSVGRALVMTTITTAIGFGSMAFYTHRGMASLGIVLTFGICSSLVATLILIPALAKYIRRD